LLRKRYEGDYEFTDDSRMKYKNSMIIVKEMMLLT
jgi:hypothetical protein